MLKFGSEANVVQKIEQSKFLEICFVVRINVVCVNGKCIMGTGFFYKINDDVFIVTNKHIVDNRKKITIYFISRNDKSCFPHNCEVDNNIKIYDSTNNDVSMFNVSVHLQGKNIFCINNEKIKGSIDIYSKEMYFSCYPSIMMLGYPDNNSKLPYCRHGYLSTNIIECTGNNEFLGDMTSIGGYSGSPVFIKVVGDFIGGTNFNNLIFLGINSGYKYQINNVYETANINVCEGLQLQNVGIPTKYYVHENTRQNNIINGKVLLDLEKLILNDIGS